VHPAARRHPKPGSGPRRRDGYDYFIASVTRRRTLPVPQAPLRHGLPTLPLCPPSCQNRPVENSTGNAPTVAIVDPPPTPSLSAPLARAAPPSNRHRRPPPAPPTAGSFPAGFRTPALKHRRIGHHGPASETLHMKSGSRARTRAAAVGSVSGHSPERAPMGAMRRFRTLAEVRCRGQVPRIADLRRDEHIVRDVPSPDI
jgi:hypothetical protein